jgi:hypothetical protein
MTAPPGWHPDPTGDQRLRYWDGTAWSEYTKPAPLPAPVTQRPAEPALDVRPQATAAASVAAPGSGMNIIDDHSNTDSDSGMAAGSTLRPEGQKYTEAIGTRVSATADATAMQATRFGRVAVLGTAIAAVSGVLLFSDPGEAFRPQPQPAVDVATEPSTGPSRDTSNGQTEVPVPDAVDVPTAVKPQPTQPRTSTAPETPAETADVENNETSSTDSEFLSTLQSVCRTVTPSLSANVDAAVEAQRRAVQLPLGGNNDEAIAAASEFAATSEVLDKVWQSVFEAAADDPVVAVTSLDVRLTLGSLERRAAARAAVQSAVDANNAIGASTQALKLALEPLVAANVAVSRLKGIDGCDTVASEFERFTSEISAL